MLVALLGLLPAALMITGCLRFMQKRKARALVQTKQSARVRRPT
jgi:uncharacterized iron-regulated membrane protein